MVNVFITKLLAITITGTTLVFGNVNIHSNPLGRRHIARKVFKRRTIRAIASH